MIPDPREGCEHIFGEIASDLTDLQLTSLARVGNQSAVGELFVRYRIPGERFARHLGMGGEASDAVAESFAQILDLLSRGKGPATAFRAYLFTTIRHEAGRRAKARKRLVPTGEFGDLDSPTQLGSEGLEVSERALLRAAFDSLPRRWRSVLWSMDVEGRSPREVGALEDMSANAVSALAYRARSGLRDAYLHQHTGVGQTLPNTECVTARALMAATIRGTTAARVREAVSTHVAGCQACADLLATVTDINRGLG